MGRVHCAPFSHKAPMVEIRRGKRSPAEACEGVDAGETGGAGRLGTAHHSENRGGTAGHPGYDDPPAAAGLALPLRRPAGVAPATARADACVPRGTASAIPKRNRGPEADSRSCCAGGRCAVRRGATPADCLVPVGRGEPAQTAARAARRRLLPAPRPPQSLGRFAAADEPSCPPPAILSAGQGRASPPP